MRIALGQMDVLAGCPEENWARAGLLAQESARRGVQLLLLPELWLSGFDLEHAPAHARDWEVTWRACLLDLARSTGVAIGGSVLAVDDVGRPANTALLFSAQGRELAAYRKVHLFAPMREKEYLSPGDAAPVFDLSWGRTALAVCYDLRFPELFRCFSRQGAALVLLPAQWPLRRVEHWQVLLRARAIENQCFLAAVNRVGRDAAGTVYAGRSAVVGPWGQVLVEGGEGEELLLADVDLEEVARVRAQFPALEDRRL